MFPQIKLLYATDDAPGIAVEDTKVDALDFLNSEETLEVPEVDDESEDDEELPEVKDEVKVEDELEEELEDKVDTEEVSLSVPRKAVLAKYPNVFKDFPHLDKAVYREQKYSELLPTIKDAEVAVEKAAQLDSLSEDLLQGNTINILKNIKEEDPKLFDVVVDKYLENLRDVDTQAYYHVMGTVIKSTILAMANSGDEDNKIAAGLINKFIFNSDKFTPATRLSQDSGEKDERTKAIEEKEKQFFEKQLDTHTTAVNTRIHNIVTSAIDKNIDPRGSMNEFTKNTAIEKCTSQLQSQISKDTRFQGILDKLWQKAAENDFSQESLDRIRSAYWSKAKGLLPDIIRKTRNTALKGLGTKSPNERSQPLPVGRPSSSRQNQNNSAPRSSGSSDKDKARQIPKGTKSVDFLMRD